MAGRARLPNVSYPTQPQVVAPPVAKKVPLERTFHGDTVIDEYEWMRDKDPVRSKRVTDAMLKMIKLDIPTLEAAYRG